MKKITLLLLASFSLDLVAQETAASPNIDYLKKSKNQRTAAKVLLIGGGALVTISLALTLDDLSGLFDDSDKSSSGAADILAYTGGAAMLGSIPLFIAASKNRQKAIAISLSTQPVLQSPPFRVAMKKIPSLSLTLHL